VQGYDSYACMKSLSAILYCFLALHRSSPGMGADLVGSQSTTEWSGSYLASSRGAWAMSPTTKA
jgi:hypothetical protein